MTRVDTRQQLETRMSSTTIGRTPPRPSLLLGSQLIFNIGFYSVVPFLAIAMRQEFLLGTTAVALVLGARTFSQQGLFLFGGVAADRWGARRIMLLGCLVRVAGYVVLATASDLPLFLIGAIVTGMGGALFSPAMESLVGAVDRQPVKRRSASLFAWLAVCGECGAVLGPVLGALLLGYDFRTAVLSGAAIFLLMAGVLWKGLPADARLAKATGEPGAWACLRDRRFVCFAAFGSVSLLGYNQLYLGLPLELERAGLETAAFGFVFAYVSVLTIILQLPVSRLARWMGARKALPAGFFLQALGLGAAAILAPVIPAAGTELAPALLLVTGLALGHMMVVPLALALVQDFAGTRGAGSFFGLYSTCGGVVVLLGNLALGPFYAAAETPGPGAAVPWAAIAAASAVSGLCIRYFLPQPGMPRLAWS